MISRAPSLHFAGIKGEPEARAKRICAVDLDSESLLALSGKAAPQGFVAVLGQRCPHT